MMCSIMADLVQPVYTLRTPTSVRPICKGGVLSWSSPHCHMAAHQVWASGLPSTSVLGRVLCSPFQVPDATPLQFPVQATIVI